MLDVFEINDILKNKFLLKNINENMHPFRIILNEIETEENLMTFIEENILQEIRYFTPNDCEDNNEYKIPLNLPQHYFDELIERINTIIVNYEQHSGVDISDIINNKIEEPHAGWMGKIIKYFYGSEERFQKLLNDRNVNNFFSKTIM
jgi:hypothetical protein